MSDTNRALKPQKIATHLKFLFKKVEILYYVAKKAKSRFSHDAAQVIGNKKDAD